MQVPRAITTKTFQPKFSEVSKDIPLFHYNTTIVDLKPFNPEDTDCQDNYIYNNYNDFYPRQEYVMYNSPPSPTKKYLINKNLNFYEPVKDAEMLAQFKTLRHKLKDSEELTILPKRNANLRYTKSLNLPDKSKISNLAVKSATTHKGTMASSMYTDEDKTSALADDYLNSSRKVSRSNKDLTCESSRKPETPLADPNVLLDVQVTPIEADSEPKEPIQKTKKQSDAPKDTERDNYSLKSYNLSSFASDKKGIKTPECNVDYYVNQGNQYNEISCDCDGDHQNHHVITIPNSNQKDYETSTFDFEDMCEINRLTKPLQNKQKSAILTRSRTRPPTKARAHTSFNNQTRQACKTEINLKTSFSRLPQALPDITPFNINVTRNVKNVLRKSTRSRLGNIYKVGRPQSEYYIETSDPQPSPKSEYYSNDSCNVQRSCQSRVSKPTNCKSNDADYRTEIDTQDGIELANFNPTSRKSIFTPSTDSSKVSLYKTILITDTSNALNKNPNLRISNQGFPHERQQRKEAPIPMVQNIISDIPSTLNRMSVIGNVTNVEKLISNRLSEFYTTNRIIN